MKHPNRPAPTPAAKSQQNRLSERHPNPATKWQGGGSTLDCLLQDVIVQRGSHGGDGTSVVSLRMEDFEHRS
jgi:hypothetical protein